MLFAILFASVVFPTPGGPTKHIIGLFILGLFFLTAKYSITLSFTSSSPKCVSFNLLLMMFRSSKSVVTLFQGRSSIHSI